MAIRDSFNKLAGFLHKKVNESSLSEKDVAAARKVAKAAFPDRCAWHPLDYPGRMCLPVFLVPLAPPLPAELHAAVEKLHTAIHGDGFAGSRTAISSRHEQRQAHLWLALMAKDQYLPIGQATFVLEERRSAEDAPAADPVEPAALRLNLRQAQRTAGRWWLHHAWLSPAYRSQRIFRQSVQYLSQWHPGFLVRDPYPPLARALKEHPEHMFEANVQWF